MPSLSIKVRRAKSSGLNLCSLDICKILSITACFSCGGMKPLLTARSRVLSNTGWAVTWPRASSCTWAVAATPVWAGLGRAGLDRPKLAWLSAAGPFKACCSAARLMRWPGKIRLALAKLLLRATSWAKRMDSVWPTFLPEAAMNWRTMPLKVSPDCTDTLAVCGPRMLVEFPPVPVCCAWVKAR